MSPARPFGTSWRGVGAALTLLLTGCADTGYLLDSARGHLRLMQAARPIDQWLADPQTPPALKQRLELAHRIRAFAVTDLYLPDNASYRRYADLQRHAVVWNVVAAPEWSLTLQTWCFPVTGCVGYRGYFNERDAQVQANTLRAQGLEVKIYPVPAYSTLGWMNWAGGDPLLNTFIHYPQGELARMLFHEMAHQVVYVKDDTAFNESFATAVERLGGSLWLERHAPEAAREEYAVFDNRRRAFRALTLRTRQRLNQIYASNASAASDKQAMNAMKNIAYADFRSAYAALKTGWNGYSGYDTWVAEANNAALGAQAAYDDWVEAFEALHAQQHGDWPAFYRAVKILAALPKAERTLQLQGLQAQQQASKGS